MRLLRATISTVVLGLLVPAWAAAQTGPARPGELARQSLRPYAHVFIAYAVVWALVLGWVVSIFRRWSRVEEELRHPPNEE